MRLRRLVAGVYGIHGNDDFRIVRTDWDVPDERFADNGFDRRPHRIAYLWEIIHVDKYDNWVAGEYGEPFRTLKDARAELEKVLSTRLNGDK